MISARRATPLKKIALVLAVSAMAASIVLPVIHSVNYFSMDTSVTCPTLRADGDPLPPPRPNPPGFAA